MPTYNSYSDSVETVEPDEPETHRKIIEVMTHGQDITREKYNGRAVRIPHAKAHGIVKGKVIVREGLPAELAQGIFAQPATYPVVVRLSHAPGELVDDTKVSTPRGMAIKFFNVEGARLPGSEGATTQDWVLDTGKEFITGGAKAFLQAFKPNASIAPRLSDSAKGAVSTISLGTNKILDAIGFGSAKLDSYGHANVHPLAEPYFSLPLRGAAGSFPCRRRTIRRARTWSRAIFLFRQRMRWPRTVRWGRSTARGWWCTAPCRPCGARRISGRLASRPALRQSA